MTVGAGLAHLIPPVSERDHCIGPNTAPVILVEYGDYECPYCGQAHPIVQQVLASLPGTVRFAFRNFPLATIHPHAEGAAEAAEAAGAQGKFWPMHDMIYENQRRLGGLALLEYAAAVGLDLDKFAAELEEGVYKPRVREDFMSGVKSGVNGTPAFFINGIRHDGSWDAESLLAALVAAGA